MQQKTYAKFFMIVKLKAQQSYPFRPQVLEVSETGAEWWCGTVEGSDYMARKVFSWQLCRASGAEVRRTMSGQQLMSQQPMSQQLARIPTFQLWETNNIACMLRSTKRKPWSHLLSP
jgi:hypothetical protein